MRAVRDNDAGTFHVATRHMIFADYHEACELAVRSCERIESELCHSGYCRQGMRKILV